MIKKVSFVAIFCAAYFASAVMAQCGHIGIYYWGGKLYPQDTATQLYSAKVLADSLNVNTIRITLACNDDIVYKGLGDCLTGINLANLAETGDYSRILRDPQFSTIIITAYDWTSFGDCATTNFLDTAFYTPENTMAIENEYTNFATFLKSIPGKEFIITSWEADNQCYCGAAYYDDTCPSAPANIAGITKWMNARAAGISAANAPNVKVGIEFCNIHSLENAGKPDILDTVIPHVYSDYYLYSSYESINISPAKTDSDITFIRQKLAGFGKDSSALLIGEMGFSTIAFGRDSAATRLQQIIDVVNRRNIPTAVVWTLLDSPTDFGAYDSTGAITPIGTVVKNSACATSSVESKSAEFMSLSVLPNPAHNAVEMKFIGQPADRLQVEINNMLGNSCYAEQVTSFNGYYDKHINLSTLAPGMYIAQVKDGTVSRTEKIIIY